MESKRGLQGAAPYLNRPRKSWGRKGGSVNATKLFVVVAALATSAVWIARIDTHQRQAAAEWVSEVAAGETPAATPRLAAEAAGELPEMPGREAGLRGLSTAPRILAERARILRGVQSAAETPGEGWRVAPGATRIPVWLFGMTAGAVAVLPRRSPRKRAPGRVPEPGAYYPRSFE